MSQGPRNIFLSSTCYDLSDLRAAVEAHLRKQGHHPLLSDRSGFPVDPNKHRHQVCVDAVCDANLLILVIDTRSGAPFYKDTSISITRAEFRCAIEQKVPVIGFVRSKVFNERQTWKKNRHHAFEPAHVDDVQVFEFLDEVQGKTGAWLHEFQHVGNILESLENMNLHSIEGMEPQRPVSIETLSPVTRKFLTRFTKAQPDLHRAAQAALSALPKTGYVGVVQDTELGEAPGSLVMFAPIRPADNGGLAWYAVGHRTALGHVVERELSRFLERSSES